MLLLQLVGNEIKFMPQPLHIDVGQLMMIKCGEMTLFKGKYRVESARWQRWDYSRDGYYFITIITKNREQFLGKIRNAKMHLSPYGDIVRD